MILGQLYITAVKTEMKVIDDSSAFVGIKSEDGRWSVQFLTVHQNQEWNKELL